MSLNYREIDLILKELDLEGSRIDKIHQSDRFNLVLETYSFRGKQKILISLDHGAVRICRIAEKPAFPASPPRFTQLLRSRIKGGTVNSVSQPSGERLIHFEITCRGEAFHIWIRLWSGNPNIILTDDKERIIDVLFRKPEQNEIQGELFHPDFSHMTTPIKPERHIREFSGVSDFNRFIELHYSQNRDFEDIEKEREKLLKKISLKERKVLSHIKKLTSRKLLFSQWEELKKTGELLQANLYKIEKGDSSVEVEDYHSDNALCVINLQPELTPQQNCERVFKKYKKYKQGLILTEHEINSQNNLLKLIKREQQSLMTCTTIEELSTFSVSAIKVSSKKKKPQTGLLFRSGDFNILVGRNSRENDQLLRQFVRGNDLWLHVRDYPGGYVFIKTIKGKSIPLDALLDGANLALLYSGKKYKDKADIHYAEVKNLKRVKGGKEGLVLVYNEKNLSIKYDEERIERLQNKSLLETISYISDNDKS